MTGSARLVGVPFCALSSSTFCCHMLFIRRREERQARQSHRRRGPTIHSPTRSRSLSECMCTLFHKTRSTKDDCPSSAALTTVGGCERPVNCVGSEQLPESSKRRSGTTVDVPRSRGPFIIFLRVQLLRQTKRRSLVVVSIGHLPRRTSVVCVASRWGT